MMDMSGKPDPRSVEILESVKAVFAQKGFDGASMQDLARAASMSAGNFYRYFPSKNAIIESLVERDLGDIGALVSQVMASPDPHEAFVGAVRQEFSQKGECDGPLWAEIEAASLRRPEIAAISARMEHEVTRFLMQIFARLANVSLEEANVRFSAQAKLIIILFKGVGMCRNSDSALIELTITTIDRIIADISASGAQSATIPDLPR